MPQDRLERSRAGRGKNYLLSISPAQRADLHLVRRRLEASMDTLWMPALEMGLCYRLVATWDMICQQIDEEFDHGEA